MARRREAMVVRALSSMLLYFIRKLSAGYCLEYGLKNNLNIMGFFGGTYESAKTDERNEFNRMIRFVRNQLDILRSYCSHISRSRASWNYTILSQF